MKIFIFAGLFAVALAASIQEDVELKVVADEIADAKKYLENLHPTTELAKAGIQALSLVLKGMELKFEAELKKHSGTFYDSTKEALIADASRLRSLAQKEIDKLKVDGKSLLAAEIQVLETKLNAAEKQLESLKSDAAKTSLQAIESVVKGLETKLESELKKLGGAFYDSTQAQLTSDVNRLKKQAQDEIKKLEAEGKASLASGLQILERDIVTVEKHLESLQSSTDVGGLGLHAVETVLKGLEAKLEAELKKVSEA